MAKYSVILLGLDNAGKTTFHEQVKAMFRPDGPGPKLRTVPTVGQNVSTITLPDMYLKLWDVGGQMTLRNLWHSYYSSCHAIVFIIDSTDIGDGGVADHEYEHGTADGVGRGGGAGGGAGVRAGVRAGGVGVGGVGVGVGGGGDGDGGVNGRLDECRAVLEDVLQHSDTEGVPLLILANKQDREDCVETIRIKEGLVKKVMEGEKGHSIRDSRVLSMSALTGDGVKEAIDWIRTRVQWNKESRPPVMR
ncbi:ADP-ribosylation factor related protein 1 [Geosmithia morbida]|uniref:ADP-ribosylation factor related protein 1 n=1 Tax=Geosmithia morbida TaxID=1094350 RepID=A0A9P4YWN0_9HYPO|nr:ADP-ribosylation factor related protein 1 [Geosmithia morbida]KAF4123129.1 ADP-ribosylation factor related protein 1 [Geosmithia morbida]